MALAVYMTMVSWYMLYIYVYKSHWHAEIILFKKYRDYPESHCNVTMTQGQI